MRILKRVLKTFIIVVGGSVLLFAVLKYVFSMRVELSGAGYTPIISFGSPERHDAKLEQHRAEQAKLPLTPVSAPAATAPEPAPVIDKPAIPKWTNYWTDFLGPNRSGRYEQMPILTTWPEKGLVPVWKQPIGLGYASFAVADGLAFTIEQRRANEAVVAYDVVTGREVWNHSYPAKFEESLGGPGPRATPMYFDGLVYSLGAIGHLSVLNARTGKVRWSKDILADNGAKNIQWAMSASPLIAGDNVIVLPGGADGKSVVAYNRLTGERAWSVLNDRAGYASPVIANLAGQEQIVVLTAESVSGITFDGRVLWTFPFPTEMDINAARPLVLDDTHVFITASMGHGATSLEISKSDSAFSAKAAWQSNRIKTKFEQPVLRNGYIYTFDESILICADARTGEVKWKGGRYGFGQFLMAGSHMIVLSEDGDLALVEATPEGQHEKVRFHAIDGKTWNVPAIDNGFLLVRNSNEMAAFRIGQTQ